MQLLFSAIAAGGLLGVADQYLCILLISTAAHLGLVELPPQMLFMEHPIFMTIVGVFYIITVAPAYSAFIAPGVMNVINAVANFLSGFVVPFSAAIVSLASAGIILNMHPDLALALDTFNILGGGGTEGGLSPFAMTLVAGGGAVIATAFTGTKALIKPVINTASGTAGTVSAPTWAAFEMVMSFIIMGIALIITKVDPRLLAGFLVVVALITFGVFLFALYQLWRLQKGIGRVLYLAQVHPKAGLAIVAEALVWGSGWLAWGMYGRGVIMLLVWTSWLTFLFIGIPTLTTFFTGLLITIPLLNAVPALLGIALFVMGLSLGLLVGLGTSSALLKTLEQNNLIEDPQPRALPAAA